MKGKTWILLSAALALGAVGTVADSYRHAGNHSAWHGSEWGDDWGIVAEGKFEKTLNVSGPVDLEVKSNWGSISVRTGDGSTVRVVGIIKARKYSKSEAEARIAEIEKNPPITQNGNSIVIGTDWEHDEGMRNRIGISYELVVPASTRLRGSTGSGSLTLEGVAGPVEASTGSGSVTLNNIGGDVRTTTGSGSIHMSGVKGQLRATTGSGSIHGTGVAGAITASTGSGSIELEQVASGNVEVSTGSGGIELNGVKGGVRARTGSGGIRVAGEPTADWTLHAASGGIRVKLPSNASFELRASTASGSIETDHPVTLSGKFGRRELRGRVRNGGPVLDLSTSSGSIQIN